MTVELAKNKGVVLTKREDVPATFLVGLGWLERPDPTGHEVDLDASALAIRIDGLAVSDPDFVFYNNLVNPTDSIVHLGDNVGGSNTGDAEQIRLFLDKLPRDANEVLIVVTIYDADDRGQTFSMVHGAYIRIVDETTGEEVARYRLSETAGNETAVIFGRLERLGSKWRFVAVGEGYANGLDGLAAEHAVRL